MVSVVIPVYNAEKYLTKCLDSVAMQSYKDWEIVAVNDGSTDTSLDILRAYESKMGNRMRVFTQENRGQSVARNNAMKYINGEYVTFLDSDDYIAEDYLLRHYEVANAYQSDMVASGEVRLTEEGKIVSKIRYKLDKNGRCDLRRLNFSGKLYRKEFLDRHDIRFAEGKVYEDNPFNIKCFALAKNLRIIDYIGYYQMVHMGSTTTKKISIDKLPFDMMEETIQYVCRNRDVVEDFELFQYTVFSFFTYFIFKANKQHYYYTIDGRTSSKEILFQLCDEFTYLIKTYFPKYADCRYVRMWGNKGISFVQNIGVYVYIWLTRHNLIKKFIKIYYK